MYILLVLKKLLKYLGVFLFASLLIIVASIPLARLERPSDLLAVENQQALAVDNVNLVTMNGGEVLHNRQLLIRDGIIEQIIPAGQAIGSSYRLIDADGAYALPGLIDMHVHAFDRKYLALTLAHGITSIRNMGGYPTHLRWKQELADGQWLGSNLYAGTPILNGKKNSNPLAHKVVTNPEEARSMVRRLHEQGWDFIKVYTRLSPPVYAAIVDEAAELDFPVAGHVPYDIVTADYRLAAPMVTLEHTEEIFQGPLNYAYDDEAVVAIARQLKEMDATITPTLMIFDHLTQIALDKHAFVDALPLQYLNPLMKFIEGRTSGARWLNATAQTRDEMIKRNAYFQAITRVLHENEVGLVLGSDSGIIFTVPGVSTHDEIALLRRAGIPNAAILRMATVNAARVLGVDHRIGTIETGKIADLVLSNTNPVTDPGSLRSPVAVIKNGQWLDATHLQQLKTSAENTSNAYFTMGRLLEFLIDG
jgi:imidazolonepropionase-like amidohydrolase